MKPTTQNGFTLIELMIAVAITAILLAVALPSYKNYTYRAHRTEGTAALISVQMQQEKYRSDNPSYGTMAQLGYAADPQTTANGYYTFTVTSPTATSFVATATPAGAQATDSTCSTMSITVTNGSATTAPAACWGK